MKQLLILEKLFRIRNKMQWDTAYFAPCFATWGTGQNIHAVFDSGPFPHYMTKMMPSTKPEVHNVWHCRQRRTESCQRV